MKIYLSISTVFSILTVFAEPVIINDTGNWKGYINGEKHGFQKYNQITWGQSGANEKHEVGFFSEGHIRFVPLISNSGSNTVRCIADQIAWSRPVPELLESTTSDITFITSPFLIEKKTIKSHTKAIPDSQKTLGLLKYPTDKRTVTWTGEVSTSVGGATSVTVTATTEVSASITGKISDLVGIGVSMSQSLSTALTQEFNWSKTRSFSVSDSASVDPSAMGLTWDSGTQRCRYYVGLESFEKECFIRYYDDPDDDGLSDTSALMSKTFIMVEGVYGVLDYEIVTHIN